MITWLVLGTGVINGPVDPSGPGWILVITWLVLGTGVINGPVDPSGPGWMRNVEPRMIE